MGCERMWLRHFWKRRRTAKYRKFKVRYLEFLRSDCVPLCSWHHEEIHHLYMPTIAAFAQLHGKFTELTWDEAEHLMEKLRKICAEWLGKVTPGLQPRKREDVSL
jgi:hypothetical protein